MENPQTKLPLPRRTHNRIQSQEYTSSPQTAHPRSQSKRQTPERKIPFAPSSNEGKTSAFSRKNLKKSVDKQINWQLKVYDTADLTPKSIEKQPPEEDEIEKLATIFYDIILKVCTEGCEFKAFPRLLPSETPSLTEISERLASKTQYLITQMTHSAALPDPEFHS